MKILTDENGFITSFALEGELVDGIEVNERATCSATSL